MGRELELRAAVEGYARETLKFAEQAGAERQDRIDPTQGPSFRIARAGLLSGVADMYIDLGVLVIMGVLFFLAAYVGFLRMEVA